MTFQEYLAHYLNGGQMAAMLVIAALSVLVPVALLFLYSKARPGKSVPGQGRETVGKKRVSDEFISLTERYYELIFSTTAILLFVGVYFSIDYFGIGDSMRDVWDTYGDFVLLFFILASIIFTSFIDNLIIPLSHVRKGERATMRLAGMLYMIVIFIYIKFFYEDSNYDSIILYFLTLVIGRFVYFDASYESFHQAMRDVFFNLPLLGLALISTGIIALFGFGMEYLLTANGVVLNLFIGHLYLLAVIFVVHNIFRIFNRGRRRRKNAAGK